MSKVAMVILADTETHEDLGRLVNALEGVKELKEANEEVALIFDGAGTKWVAELSNPAHRLHGLFQAVQDTIAGACSYCASAFGVKEQVQACGVPLLAEFEQHPSLHRWIREGYQVITF